MSPLYCGSVLEGSDIAAQVDRCIARFRWWLLSSSSTHDPNDPDKRMLAGAVGVFYEHLADLHQPEDVFPLLSKLVSRDYAISLLSHCEVHRLYRLFESLLAVSSIDNHKCDTVHESLEIVKRFFSGGKPGNDC
eukprot:gene11919-8506_t